MLRLVFIWKIYEILIKNENNLLCWYDIKIAQTDNDRFKVPIVG